MKIQIFEVKGVEIHLSFTRGVLAYVFEHNGNKYGHQLKVTNKSAENIINATFLLLTNAIESIEALQKDDK